MSTEVFTIGQGKRYQYAKDDNGYWWRRAKKEKGWGKWITTGSRNRPADIWYDPRAGKANLPTYEKEMTK